MASLMVDPGRGVYAHGEHVSAAASECGGLGVVVRAQLRGGDNCEVVFTLSRGDLAAAAAGEHVHVARLPEDAAGELVDLAGQYHDYLDSLGCGERAGC